MVIYFIVYISIVLLGIATFESYKKDTVLAAGVFLVFFTGLRGLEVSMDNGTYLDIFNEVRGRSGFIQGIEPTFVLLSRLLPSLGFVLFTFALISVSVKIKAIANLTPFIFFSIAIWFSNYYLIQELNQVRAGVAIGIILLSIPYILDKQPGKFFMTIIAASLFHYSALIFLPVYLLNTKRIQLVYYLIIPVAYVCNAIGIGLIEILNHLPIPYLQSKLVAYNYLYSMGFFTKISLYSPIILLRLIVLYTLASNKDIIIPQNRFFVLLFKSSIISIAFLIFFSGLPVISIRISEIFASTDIILFPFLLYVFRPKSIIIFLIFAIGILLLVDNLFVRQFVNKYSLNI